MLDAGYGGNKRDIGFVSLAFLQTHLFLDTSDVSASFLVQAIVANIPKPLPFNLKVSSFF